MNSNPIDMIIDSNETLPKEKSAWSDAIALDDPRTSERFFSKVHLQGPMQPLLESRCHDWTAGRLADGSGAFRSGGRHSRVIHANRAAWQFAGGSINKGARLRHLCGRNICVNPAHLELASELTSARDVKRDSAGERGEKAKLRFIAKVNVNGPVHHVLGTPCHDWTAAKYMDGYGMFYVGSDTTEKTGAHRFAWESVNGPVPKGLCVLHKCDRRTCVNPDHLFIGTKKENAEDAHAKGRHTHGEVNSTKLTEEKVKAIRAQVASQRWSKDGVAKNFGISRDMVNRIMRGAAWAHVA